MFTQCSARQRPQKRFFYTNNNMFWNPIQRVAQSNRYQLLHIQIYKDNKYPLLKTHIYCQSLQQHTNQKTTKKLQFTALEQLKRFSFIENAF